MSYWGYVLMVTGRVMVPMGKTLVLPNSTSDVSEGKRRFLSIPLSTSTRWVLKSAIEVYDQGVIIRVVESSNILFCEVDGQVVDPSHFRWLARNLDTLHHPQICLPFLLKGASQRTSSYNHPYLSKWSLRSFFDSLVRFGVPWRVFFALDKSL